MIHSNNCLSDFTKVISKLSGIKLRDLPEKYQ